MVSRGAEGVRRGRPIQPRRCLTLPAVRAQSVNCIGTSCAPPRDIEALHRPVMLARPGTLGQLLRIVPPAGSQSGHDAWSDPNALQFPAVPSPGSRWQLRGTPATHQSVNAALQRLSVECWRRSPPPSIPRRQAGAGALVLQVPQDDLVWTFYLAAGGLSADGHPFTLDLGQANGRGFSSDSLRAAYRGRRRSLYLAGRIPNSNMFEAVTAAAAGSAPPSPWFTRPAPPWLAAVHLDAGRDRRAGRIARVPRLRSRAGGLVRRLAGGERCPPRA